LRDFTKFKPKEKPPETTGFYKKLPYFASPEPRIQDFSSSKRNMYLDLDKAVRKIFSAQSALMRASK